MIFDVIYCGERCGDAGDTHHRTRQVWMSHHAFRIMGNLFQTPIPSADEIRTPKRSAPNPLTPTSSMLESSKNRQRTATNSILITGGGVPKAAIPNRVLDFIGWNTRFLKGFEKDFPIYVARGATSSPIFSMFCSLYFMFFSTFEMLSCYCLACWIRV